MSENISQVICSFFHVDLKEPIAQICLMKQINFATTEGSRLPNAYLSVTHSTEGFYVWIFQRRSPWGEIQWKVSLWPLSESVTWKMTPMHKATVKKLTLGLGCIFSWHILYMWGVPALMGVSKTHWNSNLTISRVSLTLSFSQIWSCFGQKQIYLGGMVKCIFKFR